MSGQRGGGGSVNPTGEVSLDESFRGIRIVCGGLLAGLVFMALLMFMVAGSLYRRGTNPSDLIMPLSLVLGALSVGAIVGQFVIRSTFVTLLRSRASALKRAADPLPEVLGPYRACVIQSYGLMEGTGLFACICYMLTEMKFAVLVWVGIVLFFLATMPTEDRARRLVQNAIESA